MTSRFLNISTDNTLGGNNSSDEVVSSQKALKHYIDSHGGGGGSVTTDNISINTNANDELQTIGVIDNNDSSVALKTWTGTFAEYTSIATKDDDTIYIITDENPTGLGAADVALSNLNSTGQAIIDGKVSKSGDIMIGNLTIDRNNPLCILKNTDLDKTSTTAPSDNIVSAFQVQDKNGNYISSLVTVHDTPNNFYQGLDISRTVNGSTNNAAFGIFLNTQNQDLAYASAGVKASITNWAFPSSRYDDLALGATGTQYTAPADGFVYVGGTQANTSGFIFVKNVNNGIEVTSQPTNVSGFEVRGFIPVSKGQLYEVHYGDVAIHWFRFIYAIGN